MRNHHQHKENNINNNNSNNNNTNNNNTNSTNRYQYCLHPVMSATVTAQHSGATPTIMNNHTSTTTTTTTATTTTDINANNNTNTGNNNNNNNNLTLSPSANSNINDTLNSQQKQITTTKISTTLFNATKTNLSPSSVSSASSSSSPSTTAATTTATSSSGSTTATSSSSVSVSLSPASAKAASSSASSLTSSSSAVAMPQTVAQQLTKLNNNNNNDDHDHDQHHHNHHIHDQIINNTTSSSCLTDSRKSINSTTKSFKEIHHNMNNNNNINNNNNNNNNNNSNSSNNNNNNCNNNHFTELMQRNNNKRLSPTQESSNMSFSSASVAGSIQDDIGDQCGLTKAGLEEYTMRSNSFYDNPVLYHHQKQSSYAQSEGYHSYVSSSDSTSATPMLDRLRQESELLSRQTSSHHWSQNDLSSLASTSVAASPTSLLSSGRDLSDLGSCTQLQQQQQQQHQQQQQIQQHNNSSESTSSTETLKWLGSMSDVSEVSHATGFSAISESVSTSQLIVHSSRVMTPKRHQSESVLYTTEEQAPQQQHTRITNFQHSPQHSPASLQPQTSAAPVHSNTLTPSHRHSPSYPPIHQTSHTLYRHQHNHHNTSPELSKSMTEKTSSETTLSNCDVLAQKSNISVTISSSEAVVTISPHPPPVPAPKPNSNLNGCNDTIKTINNLAESQSQTNISARSHGLPRQSSSLGMVGHKSVSASMDSLSDIKHPYRNNHRLFPVSTYTEPVHSNTSHFVHHPKPQYSTGLQKPQKSQQPPTSSSASSSSSSSASSPSMSGSHSNLHQPKLGSPNYPQPSWQSVAALINDFERSNDQQQPQKYTYLDPNKTHRVPNPALKAFQKNAVQSYFERQQQQQQQQQQQHNQNHAHSLDNLSPKSYQQQQQQQQQQATMRPSSLQNPTNEGVQTVLLRNSLPNNYSTTTGQRPLSEDKNTYSSRNINSITNKPPSPAPPPPPPRSRSMMPTLLRRSSSASDYAELRDQFISAPQEKLQSQSIKNISNSEKFSFNDCGMPPPPPPPRGRSSMPPRRTSSAAEYAAIRDKVLLQQAAALTHQQLHPHQHQNVPPAPPHQHLGIMSSSYHHHPTHHGHHPYQQQQQQSPQSYQTGLPPMVPPPLQDGWVPERPPKNPNLRVPSPDLPPPPPGLETETTIPDEPLPPPPPEILQRQPMVDTTTDLVPKPPSPNRRNSFAGASLRKTNFFTRSPSNDSVNVSPKGPPPLIPRKPASIELLHVSRPSAASLNQLNSTKIQPELTRATIISSSTRKRPHNLAASAASSIPAIQENVTMISNHNVRHSPTALSSPLHTQNSKSSPPPPPLMPRMTNVQQTLLTQQPAIGSMANIGNNSNNNNNVNSNLTNQKSR